MHPEHRGRGFAAEVAGAAADVAIDRAGIARYRAHVDNLRSLAVARRLGFSAYGQDVAIAFDR
ncbi:MAG: GNAT family N-acetyltransferase [Sciscionella sp.]|nr:GNAT family N-acetyltransferase [Sciscionella sp.]